MKPAHFRVPCFAFRLAAAALCLLAPVVWLPAATLTNNASIKADAGTNLTFAAGPFTVSCWMRLSIPSTVTLTTNMVILMDRTDGDEGQRFSYQLRFNAFSGDVEFMMRGDSGLYTKTLVQRPYLERWSHLAVVRSGGSLSAYVDGRLIQDTPESGTVMGRRDKPGGPGAAAVAAAAAPTDARHHGSADQPTALRTLGRSPAAGEFNGLGIAEGPAHEARKTPTQSGQRYLLRI